MAVSRSSKGLTGANSTQLDPGTLSPAMQLQSGQVVHQEMPREELATPVCPLAQRRDLVFGGDLQLYGMAKLGLHRRHPRNL